MWDIFKISNDYITRSKSKISNVRFPMWTYIFKISKDYICKLLSPPPLLLPRAAIFISALKKKIQELLLPGKYFDCLARILIAWQEMWLPGRYFDCQARKRLPGNSVSYSPAGESPPLLSSPMAPESKTNRHWQWRCEELFRHVRVRYKSDYMAIFPIGKDSTLLPAIAIKHRKNCECCPVSQLIVR